MSERRRVERAVINTQTGRHVLCCWVGPGGDSCEREGREMYKKVVPEGTTTVTYIFCTERHLQYFEHSHLAFGNLPKGMRSVL